MPLKRRRLSFVNDDGEETYSEMLLTMSEEDIVEREQLNAANTTGARRAAVVAELTKSNGHATR